MLKWMAAIVASAVIAGIGTTTAQPGGQSRTTDDADKLIRRTLDEQVLAWNRGDIPGFMDGYVRGDELRFASGGEVRNGWQATLERYQAKYTSRELMGTLAFSDLQVMVLSEDYAEVFGRFTLTRDQSVGDATGLFTLLMQRVDDRWLVRHDHTSAAE